MPSPASDDYDDRYETVFDNRGPAIRTAGLDELRKTRDAVAVLVDVPDNTATLAEALRTFTDIAAAREALAEMAADRRRRVYLVLRPDEDLTRPGRPDVEVEWIDEADQTRVGRIVAI